MDLAILRRAMEPTGVSDALLTTYLPHFVAAMRAADITTELRAVAWCSQIGHESAGLRYMAEIQTSGPGWSWDRTRYRGRGPIQLTHSANYREFGEWCKTKGFVTDSEMFVKQPELVEQPRWGFLAASWFWLHGGPRPGRINGYADAGDVLAVSRCVNGWIEGKEPNGMPDRRARWNRCLALGSALLDTGPTEKVKEMTWTGDPTFLPDVLRAEGLDVAEFPGWRDRGHGDFGQIWGVVAHHTGNNPPSDNPGYIAQHPQLGLCSQLHLNRSGRFTVVGAGIAWHAGQGSYPGIARDNANQVTIGIEAENNGTEGWSPAQYSAYVKGVAAILRKLGHDSSRVIGHKEWAGAAQGKWDPGGMDMDQFRRDVQAQINRTEEDDMGFTDEDRRKLDYIYEQVGPGSDAWGEDGDLGKNAKGQRRTLRAGLAALLRGGK